MDVLEEIWNLPAHGRGKKEKRKEDRKHEDMN